MGRWCGWGCGSGRPRHLAGKGCRSSRAGKICSLYRSVDWKSFKWKDTYSPADLRAGEMRVEVGKAIRSSNLGLVISPSKTILSVADALAQATSNAPAKVVTYVTQAEHGGGMNAVGLYKPSTSS